MPRPDQLLFEGNEIILYKVGICQASVCAPLDATEAEIEQQVNFEAPTGVAWGWQIAHGFVFTNGEPNPCACNADPAGRQHWLLYC